jgi:6-phosphogluconolactonase (cycloisomerase 2 family)
LTVAFTETTRRDFFMRLAASGCAMLPAARQQTIEYEGRADGISVFGRDGTRRWRIQRVLSMNPSFLMLDAGRSHLFAVNDVDQYEGLPAGTVESYAVAAGNGRIELIGRRPLSLSAIGPRHLALSPDGRHLVVAVYGGGAYNVLPVEADGTIRCVAQVVKEIGSGPDLKRQRTAHPHSVAFHPSGRFVVATDLGADRVTLFSFEIGRLRRMQQIDIRPGSGPAELSLSRDGRQVWVEHRLDGSRSCYRFEIAGEIGRLVEAGT